MIKGQSPRDRLTSTVRAMACVAAVPFGVSAALHVVRPGSMATWANWPRSDHYQREIAIFDAVHAVGLVQFARRPTDPTYLRLVSLTGLLLGVNHHYARRRGDTGPVLNGLAAWGNTAASAVGLVLARRFARQGQQGRRC